MKKKTFTILGIDFWYILNYFIVFSVIGYIIETLYAFVLYGTLESRQSFLYGPFCGIYGLGAVLMIIFLQYFNKNNYRLFFGGFLVGSIVEYAISFIAELLFNIKWWDYSSEFLNINGRICLIYSIFWGLLGMYLMKVARPKLDKFVDWLMTKIKPNVFRFMVSAITVFLLVDTVLSGIALNMFMIRTVVEQNLEVDKKYEITQIYNKVKERSNLYQFSEKYWTNEKMLKTYPNLTIDLKDGTVQNIKDLYPEINPYYIKFKK